MAHADKTVLIKCSAQEELDFVLEGKNNPVCRPAVADISHVPGAPNRRIVKASAGPARPTGVYTLTAEGKSTAVSFALDYEPKGLAKLMDGISGSRWKKRCRPWRI